MPADISSNPFSTGVGDSHQGLRLRTLGKASLPARHHETERATFNNTVQRSGRTEGVRRPVDIELEHLLPREVPTPVNDPLHAKTCKEIHFREKNLLDIP